MSIKYGHQFSGTKFVQHPQIPKILQVTTISVPILINFYINTKPEEDPTFHPQNEIYIPILDDPISFREVNEALLAQMPNKTACVDAGWYGMVWYAFI